MQQTGLKEGELIRNVNATIKIGLKFKNWLNDGKYYYHGFSQISVAAHNNLSAAYAIANNIYDMDNMFPNYYFENHLVPKHTSFLPKPAGAIENPVQADILNSTTLHLDATLLSSFLISKFKNSLKIIDDVVLDVTLKDESNIAELILKNNGKISGDVYIDATGFSRVLMKRLKNKWNDMSDWLPIDKFIPNPVPTTHTELQPYTTAEATDNGWILQVPLQNRWGTGYLYSSQFTSDDEAYEKFDKWSKLTYGKNINSNKSLSFKSGYWEDQWVGNCLVVGLASGFAEPLEATNIHHTINQISQFCKYYNPPMLEWDRIPYNKIQKISYENIYLYLRFCYTTGRTDSEFWKYMTSTTPVIVKHLDDKLKSGYLNVLDNASGIMFNAINFTCIGHGLNKFNADKVKDALIKNGQYTRSENLYKKLMRARDLEKNNVITSNNYIDAIRGRRGIDGKYFKIL